jgi:hypothetical protein
LKICGETGGLSGGVFSGTKADVRIAKVGLGVAGRLSLFFDKENTTNLVSDIAKEMLVAATRTFIAEFTRAVEVTGFFLHGILQ